MLSAGGIREDFVKDEKARAALKDQTSSIIQQVDHTDAKKKKKEQIKGTC